MHVPGVWVFWAFGHATTSWELRVGHGKSIPWKASICTCIRLLRRRVRGVLVLKKIRIVFGVKICHRTRGIGRLVLDRLPVLYQPRRFKQLSIRTRLHVNVGARGGASPRGARVND